MRAVVQRVSSAQVTVEEQVTGKIDDGLLVYVGVHANDTEEDIKYIASKISTLRIFDDEDGKMNLSVFDIDGAVLLVSNFTLQADCRKGHRPGFSAAGDYEITKKKFIRVGELIVDNGIVVEQGIFGASMQIESISDGPATFLLDSARTF